MVHDLRAGRAARGGFTLVELLVVVTIIGMLMAMLFPAMATFLEKVNAMRCRSRLEEIAKNVQAYNGAKTHFPGYLSRVPQVSGSGGGAGGQNYVNVSWIVAIQEHMEKEVFDAFRRRTSTLPSQLPRFACPSDAAAVDEGRTSYVANCGRQDQVASGSGLYPPDWPANGVFHRHGPKGGAVKTILFRTEDIRDGLNRTLLLSENLQAGKWSSYEEVDVGFVWFTDTKNPDWPDPDSKRINQDKDRTLPKPDYNHARPSSHHPDGVNVAFCDGTTMFLSDKIAYGQVYCKLMTPDGNRAQDPGSKTFVQRQPYREPLDEALLNP
jgi:prepilin-type N-terminal cleavage/methylation domain-containing protein/prepilin-type processing-associated H-X9-DG protein